jgi:hypothetical protein
MREELLTRCFNFVGVTRHLLATRVKEGSMYGAARTVCLKTTVLAAGTVPVRSCCWNISVVLSGLLGFVVDSVEMLIFRMSLFP